MVSLTALIRAKPGSEDAVLEALLAVGEYAAAHEPGTLDYTVVQSQSDPTSFVTQERFADEAAMTAHNEGAGSKAFFAATEGMLGEVVVHTGRIVSYKGTA